MNKTITLLFIVAFNLVPVFGVIFFKWVPFDAFWFFWVETLIISVFNCIRIVFSQGRQQGEVSSLQPFTFHVKSAIKYLLIRICIFFFYSIFIITFVGFVANSKASSVNVLGTILFQNKFFNLSLLISIASQVYYLVFYFFSNGAYVTAQPGSYAAIFDSRQVVIHVAVVLGAVGGMFLSEKTAYGNFSNTFIISLFCLCKCAVELFNLKSIAAVRGLANF